MKYPIGIQSFESLIKDEYVYVDKTDLIYQLATTGRYYFLSRPRRFGKSLLISTLEAYFRGQRELFEGLAIEKLEKEWTKYPILHLDLNTGKYDEKHNLADVLNDTLYFWENLYGSSLSEVTPELRFKGIIRRAAEKAGQRVVILVDEYDKPMLQALGNEELQDEYRNTLKAFYSVMKTQDKYIRFGLLTGVTKFGKVSVFSDLNNLKDISMDDRFQTICGITQEEIFANFEKPLQRLAAANSTSYEDVCLRLKDCYDGYHFVENGTDIYNPFSLLCTLDSLKFKSYWFNTGTPSFLVKLLKDSNFCLPNLTDEGVTAKTLTDVESFKDNPIAVIYQSGYLTIKGYEERFDTYQLGFPNKEVAEGFINYLVPYYTPVKDTESTYYVVNFINDVEKGNPEQFMKRLATMFSDTDYKIVGDAELYFQNAFFIVMRMLGFYTKVERPTSESRMDMVIETKDYVYIVEFKLDGTPEEALKQIEEKGYAKPFAMDSRKLYRIGVNFSLEKRCIDRWIIE
ncbi:AAA family ATPase [Parabacteroides sp.]